jgi:murein L,D-transpeptidase YafK
MKKIIKSLLIVSLLVSFTKTENFLNEQLKYPRVREAKETKLPTIKQLLTKNAIDIHSMELLLVAYKQEDKLDVYAKNKTSKQYTKITSYQICAKSGSLGPKRKQGDEQVPEGFYYIDRYNPSSAYYLSLGINYPNSADRIKSNAKNLGGDIFIHGYCVTIGCLPMTNEIIKEIYLLSVYAKNNGQSKIPVYIFPFQMDSSNFELYKNKFKDNRTLISFWENIKIGHDKFLKNNEELKVIINKTGDYLFI